MRELFRGGGIVAVEKPPGVNVIPGREGGDSLRAQVEAWLGAKVWVVHRIDRDTSGVVVFALNAEAHREWSMAFERGEPKKRYLAIVEGRLEAERVLDWPLSPARRGRMRVSPQGKEAKTVIRPVEVFAAATLVEAEPLTGRTHQIRVHLAQAGHPLLFDHQYRRGEQSALIRRTPLHAARLEWGGVVIESPLPEDMQGALAKLRSP